MQAFKERTGQTIANSWDLAKASQSEDDDAIEQFVKFIFKLVVYPIIFIFFAVFPYIYVTYTSFKKLIKSYRKNVLTV